MAIQNVLSNDTTAVTALSSLATSTATGLSNLIVAQPQNTIGYQPQNPPSLNGIPSTAFINPAFIFHYEGEQTATLESDITDHYVEDNTAIQDQIALRPVIITTQGYIGELNDVIPASLTALQSVVNSLYTISAYTPAISVTAIEAYNEAFQIYQTVNNAVTAGISAWSSLAGQSGTNVISGDFNTPITNLGNQTLQQNAFQNFYGYWFQRTLFTIQTPWAIFQNMAIKSLKPIQSSETRVLTTFEITFKQIRTAQTSITPPQSSVSQGRLGAQSSAASALGVSSPAPAQSLSSGLSSNFGSSFAAGSV